MPEIYISFFQFFIYISFFQFFYIYFFFPIFLFNFIQATLGFFADF